MELSLFLGKFFGIYLIILGLFYLFRKDRLILAAQALFDNPALGLLHGIFLVIGGLLVVLSHNMWVWDWRILNTLLGYFMLIAGLIRLFFPDSIKNTAMKAVSGNGPYIIGIITLLLGIFLTIETFFLY